MIKEKPSRIEYALMSALKEMLRVYPTPSATRDRAAQTLEEIRGVFRYPDTAPGMSAQAIEMVDKTFGKLVVVERSGNSPSGAAQWLCRCECGNLKEVVGSTLRNGSTISCGCIQSEKARARFRTNLIPNREYQTANGLPVSDIGPSTSKMFTVQANVAGMGVQLYTKRGEHCRDSNLDLVLKE